MKSSERKTIILERLYDSKSVTKAVLAESLECSSRTVQRAVQELIADDYPILQLNDGYSIAEATRGQIKKTENTYIAGLVIMGGTIDKNLEIVHPGVSQKIREAYFNMRDIPLGNKLNSLTADVSQIAFSEEEIERFGKLARYILKAVPVTITYKKIGADKEIVRDIFPIQLKERDGIWYLTAYDYNREELRTFSTKRILKVSAASTNHEEPPQQVIKQALKKGKFSIWDPVDKTPVEIKIRLKDYAAWIIQEEVLHESQVLEIISQDEVILTLTMSDLVGIRIWLRKYAPFAEILSPASLRNIHAAELREALELNS